MEHFDDIVDIPEELVAAWLDGNLSQEEDSAFVDMLSSNLQLAEIMDAYDNIESDYEHLIENGYDIPEELGFDFLLPPIDFAGDDELLAYNQYNLFGYTSEEDPSDSMDGVAEDVCELDECQDNSDYTHEELDFI